MYNSFVRRFHRFSINKEIVNKLQEQKFLVPTDIQKKAIPLIQGGKNVVIGAETGSGKTLVYLLPIINRLRYSFPIPIDQIRKPVALILVPGAELATQVLNVIAKLDEKVADATMVLSGGKYYNFSSNTALFIATPTALIKNTKSHFMKYVETIVIDEADMLLSGSFENHVKQILSTLKNQPAEEASQNIAYSKEETNDTNSTEKCLGVSRQFIFVAATLPNYGRKSITTWIQNKFPNNVKASSELLHHALPSLSQDFVSLKLEENSDITTMLLERKKLLLEILQKDCHSTLQTIIFVNSSSSAQDIYNYLIENNYSCGLLHKKLLPKERSLNLNSFLNKTFQILIATDLAARGLDTTIVQHVIQLEFAKDVVSYIHRIGRTARAGTTGKVTNIITKENDILLKQIYSSGNGTLQNGFSRKRSLSKHAKKLKKKLLE